MQELTILSTYSGMITSPLGLPTVTFRKLSMFTKVSCKSRSNNPSLKRPIGSAAPESNCGI
jgi:hypothetical protein